MKTALIAAGALVALTLAAMPVASAKELNLGLTIGGPEGLIQIGSPGAYRGPKYTYKHHRLKYDQYRYKPKYRYKRYSPATPYGGCYPANIRGKLRYNGWQGFQIVRVTPRYSVIDSSRYGYIYRLKIDRCTARILKSRQIGIVAGYGIAPELAGPFVDRVVKAAGHRSAPNMICTMTADGEGCMEDRKRAFGRSKKR